MKRIALLFWSIVAGGLAVSAQPSLPGKCEVFYPDLLYSTPVLSEELALEFERSGDYGQAMKPKNMTFWVVYSDRDDNTTYTASSGNTKFSSLTFGEKLRIAQIRDGRALVYAEDKYPGIEYPLISHEAVCRGWVPMKNLLLWHYSLADNVGIYRKALFCVNLAEKGTDLGNMYFNPNKTGRFKKISTDMRFYFVMKREAGLSLLASTHSMDGTSDKVLEGWVPAESYVEWNQRSCLEPTWDLGDVAYFAKESVALRICSAEDLEEVVRHIEFKARQSTGRHDPHMYRMHPDELRFPILDYDGADNIYNCSSFGTPGGSTTTVEASTETESEVTPLGYTNQQLNNLLNINIGIVIDGTSSMDKYYPAVKDAIMEANVHFTSKHKVKVGVVIYRDYDDGEYVTEYCRLTTPSNPQLHDFLTTGGKYGIQSNLRDRSYEEAMYHGINVALDKLGFNPEQSNLLLVVGECGNDPADTKVSMETIVDKLVEKNVNIMGFQVRDGSENAYGLFYNQLIDIMMESLKKKYSSLANNQVSIDIVDTDDGVELANDMKSNLYIASYSYPVNGGAMQTEKLTKLMDNAVELCSKSVEKQIDLLTLLMNGTFKPSPDITGIDLSEQYLIKELGEDVYNKLKKVNALISFKGYALKKHENSGRSFFKPVMFISSDELNTLIMRLAPVNNAAVVAADDREPYVNAMKALIQSMDPSITDERINNMTQGKIMALVAGLNEAATALKGPTIIEIANPQSVDKSEYQALVANFQHKFKVLERIKRYDYKYTRMFNGLKYYWIPVEDLP